MNIYEKLNLARLAFQEAGVKKTGYNPFAKYSYFELSDILPVINREAARLGFFCAVRFGHEEATLEIVDAEKPEDRVIFCSPMAAAELKGNHAVQNLGAAETYIRRYLYLAAFEIVECDALDAGAGKPAETGKGKGASPAAQPQAAPAAKPAAARKQRPPEEEERIKSIKLILDGFYPETRDRVFSEQEKEEWREMWQREGSEATLAALKGESSARIQARRQSQ